MGCSALKSDKTKRFGRHDLDQYFWTCQFSPGGNFNNAYGRNQNVGSPDKSVG